MDMDFKTRDYLWVGKLDKTHKEVTFNPKENELSHSLLIKRIVLGPCKDAECELNAIEIETAGYQDEDVKGTIAIFHPTKEKRFDMLALELLIPKSKVKLRLQEGSGPITIYGHHIIAFSDEEEENEENENIEGEPIETKVKKAPSSDTSDKLSKKRKFSKSDGLPKKIPKMDIDDDDEEEEEEEEEEHDYDDDDDEEDDDDDDYYELPEKTKKKIETPAKKLKSTPFKIKDKKEKKKKK